MKSVWLQNYVPLQEGHHVVMTASTIQFTSLKRVASIVYVRQISKRSVKELLQFEAD